MSERAGAISSNGGFMAKECLTPGVFLFSPSWHTQGTSCMCPFEYLGRKRHLFSLFLFPYHIPASLFLWGHSKPDWEEKRWETLPRFHNVLKGRKQAFFLGWVHPEVCMGNVLRWDCHLLWPVLLTRWPTSQFSYLGLSEGPFQNRVSIWGSLCCSVNACGTAGLP